MIHLPAHTVSLLNKATLDKEGHKGNSCPKSRLVKQANQQNTVLHLYMLTKLFAIALANILKVMADIQ